MRRAVQGCTRLVQRAHASISPARGAVYRIPVQVHKDSVALVRTAWAKQSIVQHQTIPCTGRGFFPHRTVANNHAATQYVVHSAQYPATHPTSGDAVWGGGRFLSTRIASHNSQFCRSVSTIHLGPGADANAATLEEQVCQGHGEGDNTRVYEKNNQMWHVKARVSDSTRKGTARLIVNILQQLVSFEYSATVLCASYKTCCRIDL